MKRKKEIWSLEKELPDEEVGKKPELGSLLDLVGEEEKIYAIISGLYNGNTWTIALTDSRIILLDYNIFRQLQREYFSVKEIKSISTSFSIMFGTIILEMKDGNKVQFENVCKKSLPVFKNKLNVILESQNKKPVIKVRSEESRQTLAQKMQKLASLMNQGHISYHEYKMRRHFLLEAHE